MVDGATTIGGSTVLADVLNAPIAELAMSNDIDTSEYFVDAGTL